MRKFLFRCKNKEDKVFQGHEICLNDQYIKETFSQWTGLIDKNGVNIFEGDIVKGVLRHGMELEYTVIFKEGAFGVEDYLGVFQAFTSFYKVEWEVIGNIYDVKEE